MMSKTPSAANGFRGWGRLGVCVVVACLVAGTTGRLAVHRVNDTRSYVDYPWGSLSEALFSIRTPGYPLFLRWVESTVGLGAVPLLQVILHCIAAWMLREELRHRGMPRNPSIAASVSVLFGCTAADHINTISTDAPAASLGVMTAVLLMRLVRHPSPTAAAACTLAAVTAVFVRPAYLFLIPWVIVAGWLLARAQWPSLSAKVGQTVDNLAADDSGLAEQRSTARVNRARVNRLTVATGACVMLAVLCWMGLRKVVVDDFALLPFGHQNLSAVLVQLVPPETLRDIARGEEVNQGDSQVAQLIGEVADELQRQSFDLPQAPGDRIATLTLEQQWGKINYGVIWPIAKRIDRQSQVDRDGPASPIRIHRMIGGLNRAILMSAPKSYLRWLVFAVRRAVWGTAANIAMHPLFLTALIVTMLWLLVRASSPRAWSPMIIPVGWPALVLVGTSYAIMSVGLIILTSPPIGRFADAGAIFIPAILASFLVGQWSRGSEGDRASSA